MLHLFGSLLSHVHLLHFAHFGHLLRKQAVVTGHSQDLIRRNHDPLAFVSLFACRIHVDLRFLLACEQLSVDELLLVLEVSLLLGKLFRLTHEYILARGRGQLC